MDENRARGATVIPALGPRGEGWTALQVVLMFGIVVAAWTSPAQDLNAPGVGLARGLGSIVVLGGLVLITWSSRLLRQGRAFTALPRPLETGSLVESGPYRFIRHPIYAGLVVAGVGVAILRLSPIVAVLTALLFVVLDLKRRREEAWLVDRYGEYAAYRRRSRALIPFLY